MVPPFSMAEKSKEIDWSIPRLLKDWVVIESQEVIVGITVTTTGPKTISKPCVTTHSEIIGYFKSRSEAEEFLLEHKFTITNHWEKTFSIKRVNLFETGWNT